MAGALTHQGERCIFPQECRQVEMAQVVKPHPRNSRYGAAIRSRDPLEFCYFPY